MGVIADHWYAVLTSRTLGARPVAARRFGLDLVFWRDASGGVAATIDECPHRRAKLSLGRVVDGCVECPFHGFRYDKGGKCTAIPAQPDRPIPKAMAVHSFETREAHGLVWIWTGPSAAPESPIPFFDFDGWSYAGSDLEVPVHNHYTRAIENQLDFTHLPFVHRDTIGKNLAPAMEVACEVDGDRIVAYRSDRQSDARIELIGPNIWRLKTGPVWQFLAFVPVDDERMLYYVRTYQRLVRVPGLDWLLGSATSVLNARIIKQDTAVVESQPRGETRLHERELLIPSDGPIIAYRKWREAHRAELEWEKSSDSSRATRV